jgi:hypothetical protein
VCLSLSSFADAGHHFFLDAFLEGPVKPFSVFIAVFVNFFGQLVECLEAIIHLLDHPHGKGLALS